jgi:hypothetical protein
VVRDAVPGLLDVLGATATQGTATVNGNDVKADIGTLAAGQSVSITINVRVKPNAPAGTIVNTARATGTDVAGLVEDNTSSPIAVTIQGLVATNPPGLPKTGQSPDDNNGGMWALVLGLLVLCVGAGVVTVTRKRSNKHS